MGFFLPPDKSNRSDFNLYSVRLKITYALHNLKYFFCQVLVGGIKRNYKIIKNKSVAIKLILA